MTVFLIFLAFVLSCVSGLAGALTGAGAPKLLRRVGVPFVSMVFALAILLRWQAIFLMSRAAVLSQGYGIPNPSDPKPSVVGKFWYDIFFYLSSAGNFFMAPGNEEEIVRRADIATRATMGLQECLVLALTPIMTGRWFWYMPACAVLIGTWVYFGAIRKNEGTLHLFGKELLLEEVYIHGINTFVYCLMVILCR